MLWQGQVKVEALISLSFLFSSSGKENGIFQSENETPLVESPTKNSNIESFIPPNVNCFFPTHHSSIFSQVVSNLEKKTNADILLQV
jgi:hypothetical protein